MSVVCKFIWVYNLHPGRHSSCEGRSTNPNSNALSGSRTSAAPGDIPSLLSSSMGDGSANGDSDCRSESNAPTEYSRVEQESVVSSNHNYIRARNEDLLGRQSSEHAANTIDYIPRVQNLNLQITVSDTQSLASSNTGGSANVASDSRSNAGTELSRVEKDSVVSSDHGKTHQRHEGLLEVESSPREVTTVDSITKKIPSSPFQNKKGTKKNAKKKEKNCEKKDRNTTNETIFSNPPNHHWQGLMTAFRTNNLSEALAHVSHLREDVNRPANGGMTVLLCACLKGFGEVVFQLLSQNININHQNNKGSTALYIACQQGHVGIVQHLLSQDQILVNKPNNKASTPFFVACQKGKLEIVQKLLSHPQIDVNTQNSSGATPLTIAAENGCLEVVRQLLNREEINLTRTHGGGSTALCYACQNNHPEVVQLLLAHPQVGVNTPGGGSTALCYASQNNHPEVVQILLAHPEIGVNTPDPHLGYVALYLSSINNYPDIVNQLLAHPQIKVNEPEDLYGATALMVAAQENHSVVVALLLDHKDVNVNQRRHDGATALYMSVPKGCTALLELVKFDETDVNQPDRDGVTALQVACDQWPDPNPRVVQALLDHPRIDVNFADSNGDTALHKAILQNHLEIVRYLLRHQNTNPKKTNVHGFTAMSLASSREYTEIVEELEHHERQELRR